MAVGESEKLWHIPENPEVHAYMQNGVHAQEIHKKTLSTLLADLEDLQNQKVKANAELSATCWSVEIMPQQQTQKTS